MLDATRPTPLRGRRPKQSFRGTFLEVAPQPRTVQTWLFDGWPDAHTVESMNLEETDGGTTMAFKLALGDQAGRDHMTKFDGLETNFENIDSYLQSLLTREGGESQPAPAC